ncbi:hypothetical protein [Paenibacillus sp. UNC451MF]|uniref:hypothetical protein n=1 Tax=Paenibacillus sp. UNC451MF TaxID=1449063 RepID=UPI00048F4258|nr:hypothetical protein [Paenibacillus sp. UNC451MF]
MNHNVFKGLFIGMMLILVCLIGCSKDVTGDELTASQFVKSHGYAVTESSGPVHTYELNKSKLYGSPEATPYMQMWAVQASEPDRYFGQQLTIYRFTVKNHPLEPIYKKRTHVYIMMSEGKVIGGYSFPDADLAGAVYSLDGRTLEEVTGMSYADWLEKWKRKYSE